MSVSGDTVILTDLGNVSIKDLTYTNSGTHNVWNGNIYTPATFTKTGIYKQLLKVSTLHGYVIKCTPYHNFIVVNNNNDEILVKAKNLNVGDRVQNTNIAGIDINNQYNSIAQIATMVPLEDVYALNEPLARRAIFNGIMIYN